ncbi:hypothetical protein DFH29DRAFT_1016976 [Suillus ampliporus]|nr:hypothetical protein DFH29DRAFT_1016976 [Suillus ampliporus]
MAGDILLLLCSRGVSCNPAKQHLFIESLTACMGSSMPHRLRHAALRAAHSAREVLASIDVIDDAKLREMVLTKFSPAVLSAVCPRPGATPADDGPDRFFDDNRDLCYVELVFVLARNSAWRPHLSGDGHIDRCISMIARCCECRRHPFYLAGIFLRIAPEQSSVPSLESITEQQWWEVMLNAWCYASNIIEGDIHCVEFLPILVEGTKKYMEIASKSDLERLIEGVNKVLNRLEKRGSDHGEGAAVTAVKELRTVAGDKLGIFSQ